MYLWFFLKISPGTGAQSRKVGLTRAASLAVWATTQRGKLRGASQAESASYFCQGEVVARFRTRPIHLGCGLRIDDFLLTEFGKKGNGHLYVAVWKRIPQRLQVVAVGGRVRPGL